MVIGKLTGKGVKVSMKERTKGGIHCKSSSWEFLLHSCHPSPSNPHPLIIIMNLTVWIGYKRVKVRETHASWEEMIDA